MPFGSLGTIWSEIGLNTQKLDQGLMAAQLKLATADKTITSWGQTLTNQSTKLITVGGLMAGAMVAGGVASVKMAADFEKSMRNVNSISKLSEDQFKKQADAVLTLSTKMPQSAKVLADGLYDIASSGFQGADGMKVLEASAKAASAGLTDTAVSAKGITAVLNAYGLEASEAAAVSDTMFRTVDKGVITFEELASTVGDWVGMAKAANISFNEASGAIAYMTIKGISASEAGVSFTRIITGIIKPTTEMAAVIKNAGYENGEMMLKALGLTGTMKVLNDTTGGSITKLQDLIPEIRGVRGANALLGAGYEDLTKYMQGFVDTTGAADIALKEQSKSLEYQMALLKNNANAVVIALGSELIPTVSKYVKGLSEFISTHKEATISLIKFGGGAVGIISGLVLLTGAITKVKLALLSLNTASALPIGWLAVIATAVYQGSKLWTEYQWGIEETETKIADVTAAFKLLNNTQFGSGRQNREDMEITIAYLEKMAKKYPEAAQAVIELAKAEDIEAKSRPGEEITVWEEYSQKILDTADSLKYLESPMYGYYEQMHKNNYISVEAKIAAVDYENSIKSLMTQYELTREQAEEYYNTTQNVATSETAAKAEADSLRDALYTLTPAEVIAEDKATQLKNTIDSMAKVTLGAVGQAIDLKKAIDALESKTIYLTTFYRNITEGNVPGRIAAMGQGGIVGMPDIPQAAGGMVIPQTGRAIPILAHEGEMILNDSQQGNLINALWGVANGKDVGGKGITVNLTVNSPDPITPSEVARITKNTLRLAGLEAALQ